MRAASLLAILAGCAGAEATTLPQTAAPPAQAELGLVPGESMSYTVQLAGVLVGEAQLAVGEIGNVDGKRAIVVRSKAATAGAAALLKKMSDEAITTIDVDTGHPLSVETNVVNGDKITTATAKFTGSIADVTYRRDGGPPNRMRIDFKTEELHDMHSAMAQLRGWHAAPGTTRTVFVVGGRRLWRIDVKYAGEETIGLAGGNRRAVIYDGMSFRARRDLSIESKTPARTFRVWLSDDADRVPLRCTAKTELGDIAMDLVEYNRP
ncbi:MAG TPA: DUF3108 domain-containing protein [Kofleriaceae bacterium]|nr:DUF3108 domain-containing protein [Kofleriaceae bacterium]